MTLIHHFLENSADRNPDKTALVHDGVCSTYGQINFQANQLAGYFIEQGIIRGDRIVLLLENSLEYVVSYYAALKAGAVAVPLNTEIKSEGIVSILEELEPRVLVSSRKFERLLRSFDLTRTGISQVIIKSPKLPLHQQVKAVNWDDIAQHRAAENIDSKIPSETLASIIYTSGSTGRPKGAMLTHANVVANVNAICHYLKLTENDIQMVVLPFFYIMGKSLLNTHFAVGGRLVINNRFAYLATVINDMIQEKVTGFSGVPSTYALLLQKEHFAAVREKLSALRYCTQAGGHMPRVIKNKLLEVLPVHTELYIMYGATEASARLAYVEPKMLPQKLDSIGKPIPGVTLRVLDTNGEELPSGEVGELVADGPNIMAGYWKNPQATSEVLGEHGYHTGDLAYKDADGYFFVVGRKDNQLKVGGHRVNTQEIEDQIMASGMTIEVAVVGIPDAILGHKLVAVLVPAETGLKMESILLECRRSLPAYKVPSSVVKLAALPKNASGKVDRQLCVDVALASI